MFWTSKDKPSASDTLTQSCSLWQRWVSRRNIGCSSVQSSSFPGFSDLDSLRLCFLPDFCPGDPRPGLSNSGLLQPPWHQLWVRRKSECRVRAVPQETCFLDIQPQVLLRRGGILSNVPHVCGGVLRIIQEILLPVSQWSAQHLLLPFLTPFISGTIFDQKTLIRDNWFNVDCSEDTIANDATALDLFDAERTFISLGLESDEPEKDYPWRFRSTE